MDEGPFFIADLSHCVRQYRKWFSYFPSIDVFYAVKTNSNEFLLKSMLKLGSGFDCASIEELDRVLHLSEGIDFDCSSRVIYSHPCKSISHLQFFRSRGVQFTVVDNHQELLKLKVHWPEAKILLRVKVDNPNSLISFDSKFGLNQSMAIQLLQHGRDLQLQLVGCSFHVGTGCHDLQAFQSALQLAKEIFTRAKDYHFDFYLLDIGGGFPALDQTGKPSFNDIATTINRNLEQLFPNHRGSSSSLHASNGIEMKIIAEPGRYFAAASMDLVTSVIATRYHNRKYFSDSIRTAEHVYYINDGIYQSLSNILHEKATYSLTSLSEKKKDSFFDSAVYGPTCDSSDCLSKCVSLPLLETGDHLLIYHVGAYSNSCSTTFNGFRTTKFFYVWKEGEM